MYNNTDVADIQGVFGMLLVGIYCFAFSKINFLTKNIHMLMELQYKRRGNTKWIKGKIY